MPRRDGTPTQAEQLAAARALWPTIPDYFDHLAPEDAAAWVRVKIVYTNDRFDEVNVVSWRRHDLGIGFYHPRRTWNRAEAAALRPIQRMVDAGLVTRDREGWCHLADVAAIPVK